MYDLRFSSEKYAENSFWKEFPRVLFWCLFGYVRARLDLCGRSKGWERGVETGSVMAGGAKDRLFSRTRKRK